MTAKPKVTKEKLAQTATPEEISRLLETYDTYFGQPTTVDEELDAEEAQGVSFGESVEGADPGVEVDVSKAAIEPVWHLPGVAERFGMYVLSRYSLFLC